MSSNETIAAVVNSTQIEAAKILNALQRDNKLSAGIIIAVAAADSRKHVQRTLGRLAKKLGFYDLDDLIADDAAASLFDAIEPAPVEAPVEAVEANVAPVEEVEAKEVEAPERDTISGKTRADLYADAGLDPFDAAVAAPVSETVAPTKNRVNRPDFGSIDWSLAPVVSNVAATCTCPRCEVSAYELIDEVFGTRKTKRWNAKDGAFFVEISQSLCRACRADHAKAKRAEKKAAAE